MIVGNTFKENCELCNESLKRNALGRASKHHQIPVQIIKQRQKKTINTIRRIHISCHRWIHNNFTNLELSVLSWEVLKHSFESGINYTTEKDFQLVLSVNCDNCKRNYKMAYFKTGLIECTWCGELTNSEFIATLKDYLAR